MDTHPIVSQQEWIAARKALLAKEKELTRARDDLARMRRELPWVKVDKAYQFDTPRGRQSLADLFGSRSQLVVNHFMLGPGWKDGCVGCSFAADHVDAMLPHLAQRDVAYVAVSRAPLAEIEAYKKRMGWHFDWVSSFGSDFNFDYNVSFRPEDLAKGETVYNFTANRSSMSELPGISVFYKDSDGAVFHTYSCYARGLDMMNGAYHFLDLTPKGRDEAGLSHTMEWVRLHDEYGA
jgi:predicted dithiol-disulfide oxidoreductase (DUF899 family)